MSVGIKIKSLIVLIAVMILGSCAGTSVPTPTPNPNPDPVVTTTREVTMTLPTANASGTILIGIGVQAIIDSCDYEGAGDTSGAISCVAVPSAGGTSVSVSPVSGVCTLEVEQDQTYQVFLMQDDVRCAELKHSCVDPENCTVDEDRPALIAASETDHDFGSLDNQNTNGDLRIEVAHDEDGEVDLSGDDCDNDGLPDHLDVDDDGDDILDDEDDENVCLLF